MDYRVELQKSIDYIESHIHEDITVQALAEMLGFSTKHFYRLFKQNVGMPVGEYIRRRRLAHAIYDLMRGGRILDVAVAYGFETHNGFTKAFKKYYGSSPDNYRHHAAFMLPQPVNLLRQSAKYKIHGGIVMEPKIVERKAFQVAGYAIKTNGEKSTGDCPALWDKHNIEGWEEKRYQRLKPKKHGEYGVCIENNFDTGEFVYLIAVEADDPSGITKDMYAVFTTTPVSGADFSKNIQSTWNYILQEWLPNSVWTWDENKPDFEFYDERCHGETNKVMDIYVPVVKK